jgi:alanyl-tRNA synthetase
MSMAEAIKGGADAFFDEKYGETVRTVRVQDYSFELCGGTHCRATGQIGGFLIIGERSIGSGTRRIEAVTGAAADALVRERFELLERAGAAVGAQSVATIADRIASLQEQLRSFRQSAVQGAARIGPETIAERVENLDGRRLVVYAGGFGSMEALKAAAKQVRQLIGSGVIAIALDAEEPQLFVTVSDDLVASGLSAGELIQAAMPLLDGKGGGRPEMAQGRGTRREGLDAALAAIRARLETGA